MHYESYDMPLTQTQLIVTLLPLAEFLRRLALFQLRHTPSTMGVRRVSLGLYLDRLWRSTRTQQSVDTVRELPGYPVSLLVKNLVS